MRIKLFTINQGTRTRANSLCARTRNGSGQLKMLDVLHIYNYCEQFTNFELLAELCRLEELCIRSIEFVTFDLVYMFGRLTNLEKVVLELKNFTIDDALSRCSPERTLEIVCNDITNLFCCSSVKSAPTIFKFI